MLHMKLKDTMMAVMEGAAQAPLHLLVDQVHHLGLILCQPMFHHKQPNQPLPRSLGEDDSDGIHKELQ